MKYLNPAKYLARLRHYWAQLVIWYFSLNYDLKLTKELELAKFQELGLSFELAKTRLLKVLSEIRPEPYDLDNGEDSVHLLLFSALSLQLTNVSRILEIGTFSGEATAVLSELFPKAEVITVDLPETDPIFRNTYERKADASYIKFLEKRARNLSRSNVKLIETNSFFLPQKLTGKFDIIWIDGGHLYPEVAWDICNAFELCSEDGWLMCDDVIPGKNALVNSYVNRDSYETLSYMLARRPNKMSLFLKRYSAKFSANPRSQKFVAMIQIRNKTMGEGS